MRILNGGVPRTDRLAGSSRVETAVAIARYAFPDGAEEVYLARADVVADAVAAGSLTWGPVLLVPRCGSLPRPVRAEIDRLDPARVVALGGPSAICDPLLAEAAGGRPTFRLAGTSRIATAVEVSRYRFRDGADEVYLARRDDPADAVAAGSLTRGPVLLVLSCGDLPEPVQAEIGRLDPARVVALGGPSAICDPLLAEAAGGRPTIRLAGGNRIGTAVAISRHEHPGGAAEVYLTRSDVLADAVAAGVLSGGPLLLVPRCGTLPGAVVAELRRLGPSRVVAIGAPTAVCTDVLRQAAGLAVPDCGTPFRHDLGPATTAVPVVGATLVRDRLLVVSRGLVPVVVGVYDLQQRQITDTVTLPTGQGGWGTAATSAALFVGTYTPADLYRVDLATLAPTFAEQFPRSTHLYAVAASPDGHVFVGTQPDGEVYAYDPGSEQLRPLGPAVPGESSVRSIAAGTDTVYAGVGSRAHLVAIDRGSGDRRDLLPPELADETFVYALALTPQWLVAGTEPSGRVVVLPAGDPEDRHVVDELGERTIDAIAIEGDEAWFTGRTTGTLYAYDLRARQVRPLAVPLAGEETRGLFLHDDAIVGVGGSGVVWRYDRISGEVEATDLAAAGLPTGPEPVQSLAATGDTVYVGGHWGFQVRRGGAEPARLRIPGEPKAIVVADGMLYLALYPSGELWRWEPAVGPPAHVVTIGEQQARPRALDVASGSGLVVIASQADNGERGGALSLFDPATGGLSVHRNIVRDHGVSAVSVDGDTAFAGTERRGGFGTPPGAGDARVVAWDLVGDRLRWHLEPIAGATAIVGLQAGFGIVYGLTAQGVAFSVNPRSQEVLRTTRLGGAGRSLTLGHDALYAVTSTGLHRVDLDRLTTAAVERGSGFTHVVRGPDCTLWVVRDARLLHVNP